MSMFDPQLDDLPKNLPLFPLNGVILLPRAQLPLNIFEPRYLEMVNWALKNDRLLGIIQPEIDSGDDQEPATLYSLGCAGRIIHFEETADGRYLINLRGICRFMLASESAMALGGFRMGATDFSAYADDLIAIEGNQLEDRDFVGVLKRYLKKQGAEGDLGNLENQLDERMINSLSMVCPFESQEKQALLQARTLSERIDILKALVQMAVLSPKNKTIQRQ